MADTKNELPEGTDTVIAGAGTRGTTDNTDALITSDVEVEGETRQGIRGMISNAGTKIRDEGATRARGLVGQGLERSSAALTNISDLVDDTVQQIEDRLGPQYADYARSASQALNRYATNLQTKNPDELVDDARDLIRKSPAVAIAGAAIIGFGIARLLKAGLDQDGGTSGKKRSGGNN